MATASRGSFLLKKFVSGAAATVLAAMLLVPAAEASVGRTVGDFSVTPTGAATYMIPIFTPPGPRGMQPSIALSYNSNVGRGYLGVGWSLAGFSAIERCNKTIAQDGAAGPIILSLNDRYCLDGNRLRKQSGTYGDNGSVWATELADFSRITASGTTNSGLGGPQYWTVERKDGTTYTYGGTTDSAVAVGSSGVIRGWRVSQIQDRSGNKIKFTYKAPDSNTSGTTHPLKIEWTQTSANSGSYVYSMEFSYGANSATSSSTGFVAGETVRDTELLTSISVKNSGSTVRKYVLAFGTSSTTGAKRLDSVTECSDAAATDCLAPTTIWLSGRADRCCL